MLYLQNDSCILAPPNMPLDRDGRDHVPPVGLQSVPQVLLLLWLDRLLILLIDEVLLVAVGLSTKLGILASSPL